MAIVFDMYGNLIPQKVKYKTKHSDLTKDVINELVNESTEKYYCSKCNTYHKRIYRGKKNFTFIKHINSAIEVSEAYVWSKKMRNSFGKYDIRKHVKTIGSRKQ